MASGWYNLAVQKIMDGTIDLDTDTLKVMLVQSGYSYDPDDDFVDNGGAADPIDQELTVTGYTGGFGGAGRKTLANKAVTKDDTNDYAIFDNTADITWTALGSGETIAAAIVIKEVTADTDSYLICYLEVTSTATNGGDITLQFHTNGIGYMDISPP